MPVRFDADAEDYNRAVSFGAITQFTVTCWANIRVDRNNFSTPWSLHNTSSDVICFQTDSDGVTMNVAESAGPFITGPAMTVGSWYFIGVAWNSNSTSTLVHRLATAATFSTVTGTGGDNTITATNFVIGESAWGSEWLNGSVCAVKLWTALLTAEEMQHEAFSYQPKRFTNLRAWYPLAVKDTTDWSGNGQTLSGGASAANDLAGPPIGWGFNQSILIASTIATISGAASLTVETSLTASGLTLEQAASTQSATGTLTASAVVLVQGAIALSAVHSEITTSGLVLEQAASSMTAETSLTC